MAWWCCAPGLAGEIRRGERRVDMSKHFEGYAKILITVWAKSEDINGPNELRLSDRVQEIQESLELWLDEQAKDQFRFDVESR